MSDESEDAGDSSIWRDPCPCALVAHEDCLLDWIADLEAPKNARSRGIGPPKIECPQCKAEIQLSRPRDYIVEAVNALQRLGNSAVVPISGLALTSGMHHLSQAIGMHTIYAIFGAEDGRRLLQPLYDMARHSYLEVDARNPGQAMDLISNLFLERLRHWRLLIGLPTITPILVLSRTSFADSVLPVLPVVFFATQATSPDHHWDLTTWPPSASFAFAVLPYVRSLYNAYYKKVWAEKEKQWLVAVKPRVSQQNEEDAAGNNGQNPAEVPAEGENIFEVHIDHNVWDDGDWAEEEEEQLVQQAADRQPAALRQDDFPEVPENIGHDRPQEQREELQRHLPGAGGFPRAPNNEAAPAPVILDHRRPNAGAAPAPNQPADQNGVPNGIVGERRLSLSINNVAQTVLGALFFPTIAGISGEALKLVLPYTWVTEPAISHVSHRPVWAKGFLQKKWARSLVGGCLFVVGKDALLLYVRWKMAQMHKRRRVVDVDIPKGRGSSRTSSEA